MSHHRCCCGENCTPVDYCCFGTNRPSCTFRCSTALVSGSVSGMIERISDHPSVSDFNGTFFGGISDRFNVISEDSGKRCRLFGNGPPQLGGYFRAFPEPETVWTSGDYEGQPFNGAPRIVFGAAVGTQIFVEGKNTINYFFNSGDIHRDILPVSFIASVSWDLNGPSPVFSHTVFVEDENPPFIFHDNVNVAVNNLSSGCRLAASASASGGWRWFGVDGETLLSHGTFEVFWEFSVLMSNELQHCGDGGGGGPGPPGGLVSNNTGDPAAEEIIRRMTQPCAGCGG